MDRRPALQAIPAGALNTARERMRDWQKRKGA
jgi:hypothetical protein